MEDLLQVGVINRVHGVHGEVKVFPTTSDPKRYKKLKEVVLKAGKEDIVLKLKGVKFFKQFVIVKFEGFDTPESIEKYKGQPIYVTRENAVKLEKDEYFIADLIGVSVFEEDDTPLGTIKDVIETGANDVYVVEIKGENDLLIPAIKQCIKNVDIENNRMVVHLLEGLRS